MYFGRPSREQTDVPLRRLKYLGHPSSGWTE